jgi:hypothetical protein
LAWDIPVGTTKGILGGSGAVVTGAGAVVDPEPTTKIALGGASVVSGSWAVEGVTQVFGAGPVGGFNPLQEAAGWYGRTVGGAEGELWARRGMAVSQFAFGMAGGMAKTNIGTAKFNVKNLRGWSGTGKDALKADYRAASGALNEAFKKWNASKSRLHGAVSEWARMQKSLASKTQASKFNTATVVYDSKTGQYFYGMNRGIRISGNKMNPTLSSRLPEKSLNKFKLGNCAENDAVNQALNAGSNIDDLTMHTIGIKRDGTIFMKPQCENCLQTSNSRYDFMLLNIGVFVKTLS